MRYVVALLIVLSSVAAMAQDTDSTKVKVTVKAKPVRYAFTLNSNVLFCGSCLAESSLVALPTTIHGIKWRNWRVGAGVGYTSYGPVRAMPYFGSVTFNLFGKKKQNGLFLELNYGGAHAWLGPGIRNGEWVESVRASNFAQLSAGYAFHYHGLRLAAQGGISTLITERTFDYGQYYNYTWGSQDFIVPPRREHVEYETTRAFLAISVGI